jgi:hypothetical protein
VVAPQDKEILGVLDLVRQQQTDRLERLLASVDVIAQKQVIRLWREPAVLKQPEQVIVLPVNVAADLDGRFELEQDRLPDKNLARFGAEVSYFVFKQLDGFAGAVAAD